MLLCPATFLRHEASLSSSQVAECPVSAGVSGHLLVVTPHSAPSLCTVFSLSLTRVSVEEIMMGSRWAALAALLALAEATKWSNIGFMSSQDQAPANKRSAEDGHVWEEVVTVYLIIITLSQELSLDDMDLSASETQYDAVPYTDLGLSSGEAESRVEPFRRRK